MKMRISDQEIEFIRLKNVIIYKSAAVQRRSKRMHLKEMGQRYAC